MKMAIYIKDLRASLDFEVSTVGREVPGFPETRLTDMKETTIASLLGGAN